MANIKSQIKRIGTSEKARQRNASFKSQMRTAIKKVRLAVEEGRKEDAVVLNKAAASLIDKSVVKGIQHRKTAARQKRELDRLVNSLA
ncbi:MAG: 30S ribosomal protein S20 [Bacilli bacterium]|jgi:small subunit ribosomal protein S20